MALPLVELLCDKPTHWDSTYIMLNCLRILQQAINHWIDLPAQCTIVHHKLSPINWQVLQDLKVILEALHHTQQCMSGETSPLLGNTILAFEGLIQRWKLVADHVPHCAPLVDIGLTWAAKLSYPVCQT
ncbi:uncharacterized protein BJ212DRAFT_1257671 [Suillus subaureus]|uniref:Uncharacterized protein n=1 Tax=Suillus subaureus TaxID=48587 RepID=A0A9P7JKK3_9AGAM|nr:uncharacterized protein BJ212DRAFT_1257671 [Suillus subaureus]KAG1827548.1 hypothetical protein BJ212DRAFT_1257671 [Suillus subaureus]